MNIKFTIGENADIEFLHDDGTVYTSNELETDILNIQQTVSKIEEIIKNLKIRKSDNKITGYVSYGAFLEEVVFNAKHPHFLASSSKKVEIIFPEDCEVYEDAYGNFYVITPDGKEHFIEMWKWNKNSEPVLLWCTGYIPNMKTNRLVCKLKYID